MNDLDRLIDIRAIATRTLDDYCDDGSTEEESTLRDALERIARLCADVPRADAPEKRSWLECEDVKLVRFHAGDTTKFVGTRKVAQSPADGMLVEVRCLRMVKDGYCAVRIECNGQVVLNGSAECGLHQAERMAVGAVHGLLARKRANLHSRAQEVAE